MAFLDEGCVFVVFLGVVQLTVEAIQSINDRVMHSVSPTEILGKHEGSDQQQTNLGRGERRW